MNKFEELEKQVELYEKNIESQQQSLQTLKRELERLKKADEENESWQPNRGGTYYYIGDDRFTWEDEWDGLMADNLRYEFGNVFRTQEEAEFRAEQLKVEAELRRFSRPFVSNKENHYMRYNHESNTIYIDYLWRIQDGGTYFDTAEIAQKAIDTVGEERIKKYYFGVED